MSDISGEWAALASDNERLIQVSEIQLTPADSGPSSHARPQWAELASQRERLVEYSDPLFGLTGSRRCVAGMRQVAGAA